MYNCLYCPGVYLLDFHYLLDEVESVFGNVSVFELACPNHAICGTLKDMLGLMLLVLLLI